MQADHHLAAISDSENETHGFQWCPVTSLSLSVLLVYNREGLLWFCPICGARDGIQSPECDCPGPRTKLVLSVAVVASIENSSVLGF